MYFCDFIVSQEFVGLSLFVSYKERDVPDCGRMFPIVNFNSPKQRNSTSEDTYPKAPISHTQSVKEEGWEPVYSWKEFEEEVELSSIGNCPVNYKLKLSPAWDPFHKGVLKPLRYQKDGRTLVLEHKEAQFLFSTWNAFVVKMVWASIATKRKAKDQIFNLD